ncbi:putative DEAD-box ATP-dependent RNA helicase 48 [Cocos nucifera]|nr:putative DEAD-box ATP-dependent RNA helicase 48 [Cocos nucifera]
MGGGPRTYPGGVSKWQWKRMQAKKAKQLLKARLCRERQLYEMRKRTELKAAISELERPWEVVERAPNLFSVSADEQVKALADRFQRPGGFDMWNEKDGPQIFQAPDALPSARFFPKGVVHSVKPYGVVAGSKESLGEDSSQGKEELRFDDWIARGGGGVRRRRSRRSSNHKGGAESEIIDVEARALDGGSNEVAENKHPSSGNSTFAGKFGRKDSNAMEDQTRSGNSTFARKFGHVDGNAMQDQTRLGNSTFARKFGREDGNAMEDQRVLKKEYVPKDSLEDKDANIEPNGMLMNRSTRRQHRTEATVKGESGKMVGIGRNTSSTRRYKGGRISLRPTTDLH